MNSNREYGICEGSEFGHDQNVDDPVVSPCIHCGVLIIYNETGEGNWVFRHYDYLIHEEPA